MIRVSLPVVKQAPERSSSPGRRSATSLLPLTDGPQIVRAANGITLQLIHTDAEGRMMLADTLALAALARTPLMLDFATLTGACMSSLTERMSGILTNRPALAETLVAEGRESGERVWALPLDSDFDSGFAVRYALRPIVSDGMPRAVEGLE